MSNRFVKQSLQSEVECCAFVECGVCPDVTAMKVDDARYSCQADACAFKFREMMQTLECAEKLISVRHIEADTVVTHKIG